MTDLPTPAAPRGRGIYCGKPLGIPLYLAPSWLFVALFVTFDWASLIANYRNVPSVRAGEYLTGGAVAVLLALSIVAHELGHCAVALSMRVPVRRITLFLFGGVSELEREPETAGAEYLVSIAGPLVSLMLCGVGAAVTLNATRDSTTQYVAFSVAFYNGVIAAFNLLPGLPLDGGRVIRAVFWGVTGDGVRASRAAMRCGQVVGVLVAGAGAIYSGGQRTSDGIAIVPLVVSFLVGAFIYSSNVQGLRRLDVLSRMPSLGARELAWPVIEVSADLPLAEALRRAREAQRRLLIVDSYGRPAGMVSAPKIEEVPVDRQPWVTVGSVSRALEPGLVLEADARGEDILRVLRDTPASEYLVVEPEGGAVVGVLARRDVVHRLEPAR